MRPALAVYGLDGRAKHGAMIGQQRGKLSRLFGVSVQAGKTFRDFLKAEHVRIGQRSRNRDDALQIDDTVAALAPLDIPRDQKHQRIPARIKDCTNWRWNSRKAISS